MVLFTLVDLWLQCSDTSPNQWTFVLESCFKSP